MGLVGESGCGKSTLGRTVLGLHPATSGRVLFDGLDVHAARGADRLRFKKRAQIVLQNPAMKLLNEIVAPEDGVIKEIFVQNETFVGYDDKLMEIEV